MSVVRVLVAIEARDVRQRVVGYLRSPKGAFRVTARTSGRAALGEAGRRQPQAIVLHASFERGPVDESLCANIRSRSTGPSPAILLVAEDLEPGNECEVVRLGADLCLHAAHLTRATLRQSIRALLTRRDDPGTRVRQVGDVLISRDGAWIRIAGETFHLTPDQSEIVWRMAETPGVALGPGALLAGCGRLSKPHASRLLYDHISRIRARLGPYAVLIKNVRGRGYMLDPSAA